MGRCRGVCALNGVDIAELTQHIPDRRKHLVRYFGGYSNNDTLGQALKSPNSPLSAKADG